MARRNLCGAETEGPQVLEESRDYDEREKIKYQDCIYFMLHPDEERLRARTTTSRKSHFREMARRNLCGAKLGA